MIRLLLLFGIFFYISLGSNSYSQEIEPDRTAINLFYDAEAYMYEQNFDAALRLLMRLEEIDPENPNIWYKIGVCYLHTRFFKSDAEKYLEKAVFYVNPDYKDDNHRERTAPLETFYYLGQAYRLNYKFDESLDAFNELLNRLDPRSSRDKPLIESVERQIQITNNAIYFTSNPVNAELRNMGPKINTRYTEHSPIVDLNESILIFTSRRPRPHQAPVNQDEDIFVSLKKHNVWQKPIRLGAPVNTEEHNESAIGLSIDGKQMFFFRSGYDFAGNIYVTNRLDENGLEWDEPQLLRDDINTKYEETHATIAPDGNSIFFTSNRRGGFGGKDIYVMRKLPNGTWSRPKILSDVINTPYNEETPFLHPDGVTMFFSSEGHNSMGGYDVFSTTMDRRGNFTKPVNLGYPINTPDDDVSYVMNLDGRRGYIASVKEGGFGDLDLYEILQEGIYYNNLIVYDGVVSDINNNIPEDLIINVRDARTGDNIGIYRPSNIDGRYLLVLFPDQSYEISYEASGHLIHSIEHVPTNEDMQSFSANFIPIELDPVLLQAYLMHDFVYFDDEDTHLDAEAEAILNGVVATVNSWEDESSNIIININLPIVGAHPEKNQNRVQSIREYLKKQNISEDIVYLDGMYPEGYVDVYGLDIRERVTMIAAKDLPVADTVYHFIEDTTVIRHILFDFDRFNVRAEYHDNLNQLAEYLLNNPNARIEIGGHTDWLGTNEYNYLLSYRRAKSVKDFLVDLGCNPANIITTKYGETQPIAANITPDGRDNPRGRRYNRRAEFSVIAQGIESYLMIEPFEIDESLLDREIYDGVKWTVQIFALKNKKPVEFFADLVGVKLHISEDGWHRYYVGEFDTRREARTALQNLRSMGYDPFIRKLSFFEDN